MLKWWLMQALLTLQFKPSELRHLNLLATCLYALERHVRRYNSLQSKRRGLYFRILERLFSKAP